ncbi:MAG TPA: Uma2 family endonuclease [Gemmataceae bacterium]|jgi:Uma2 family endonuclease|nr:Uma2 family endonuclease [Gemmataceae bacterium]
MATVSKKLISAEEFARMPDPPDGSQQELVRGEIVTMPPPGGRHGVCCLRTGRRLGNFVEENRRGTVTCNDTGFISERDPDTVRGPDVAYWSKERLPEVPEGYIEIVPDLAVEVVSPSDIFSRIQKKVREYLNRGVRLVWVVDPEGRTVTVYRPLRQATILEENETLSGEDVLPGFSCPVAELFE